MAELKTKPTNVSVKKFLNSLKDEQKREDSFVVMEMMKKITGEEPKMWGPSIVGFGKYHYKYDSGHEGDMCMAGFSPRKEALTIYLVPGFQKNKSLMEKLGKHKTGKSCLYIKKLEDVELNVLEKLISNSFKYMNNK